MNNTKTFLRENYKELSLVFIASISLSFIPKELVYGIVATIICFAFSIYGVRQNWKKKKQNQKKRAKRSFLSSFFHSLDDDMSGKQSYEKACRYLVGYEETKPYDELFASPDLYNFGEDQQYFSYALEKDSEQKVHLMDYRLLTHNLDQILDKEEAFTKKAEKTFLVFLIVDCFSLLLLATIFSIFPNLKEECSSLIFQVLGMLCLSFFLPCFLLLSSRGNNV